MGLLPGSDTGTHPRWLLPWRFSYAASDGAGTVAALQWGLLTIPVTCFPPARPFSLHGGPLFFLLEGFQVGKSPCGPATLQSCLCWQCPGPRAASAGFAAASWGRAVSEDLRTFVFSLTPHAPRAFVVKPRFHALFSVTSPVLCGLHAHGRRFSMAIFLGFLFLKPAAPSATTGP